MVSPFVIFLVVLILVFFAANAVLFMIARTREANRDQKDKQQEEGVTDDEIEGFLGSKP